MRLKIFGHFFLLNLIFVIVFAAFSSFKVFGQQDIARQVDVYASARFDREQLRAKTLAFVEKMKKDGSDTGGIVMVYSKVLADRSCMGDRPKYDSSVEVTVREVVGDFPKEVAERIKIVNVDQTLLSRALFWIVPRNAEDPEPVESGYHPGCPNCPMIRIVGMATVNRSSRQIEFEAIVDGSCKEDKYHWQISAGTIVRGQGTGRVVVDLTDVCENKVIATFHLVKGLPECLVCPSTFDFTTHIVDK